MIEKPCLADHGEYREGCRVCWLWKNDKKYANLTGEISVNNRSKYLAVARASALPPIQIKRGLQEQGALYIEQDITKPVPEHGIHPRIKKRGCAVKCQWTWSVFKDGTLFDNGDCQTHQEAVAQIKVAVEAATAEE